MPRDPILRLRLQGLQTEPVRQLGKMHMLPHNEYHRLGGVPADILINAIGVVQNGYHPDQPPSSTNSSMPASAAALISPNTIASSTRL